MGVARQSCSALLESIDRVNRGRRSRAGFGAGYQGVERPDELLAEPIGRYLILRNILIDVGGAYHKISNTPSKPIVGGDYGFQISARYCAFGAIEGGLKISSEEVIEEAKRA